MTAIGKALSKFTVGDGLTDKELVVMLDLYTNAEETLGELVAVDPAYRFAYRDVVMNLERLRGFNRYRSRKSE